MYDHHSIAKIDMTDNRTWGISPKACIGSLEGSESFPFSFDRLRPVIKDVIHLGYDEHDLLTQLI